MGEPMKKRAKVLITDAHLKQAYVVMCSLAKRGVEVSLVSANPSASAFASRFCRNRFVAPAYSQKERYLRFLLERVQETSYDLLIPCDDLSVLYLSQARERFLPYVALILPDHRTVETAAYKDNLVRFAEENGIPIPKSFCPQTIEAYEDLAKRLEGDVVVVKGVRGAGARQVRYVPKGQIETAVQEILKSGASHNPRLPILQEFVPGVDATVFVLCDQGRILSMVTMRRLRMNPPSGGAGTKVITVRDPQAENLACEVARKIGWHGVALFEFFRDVRDGSYKLVEINPRFATSTQVTLTGGVDLPYLFWRHFVEKEPIPYLLPTPGTVYRSFPEELLHCFARPSSFVGVLSDCFRPRIDYGWHPFEWKVAYRQFKGAWWEFQDRCRAKSFRYPCGQPPRNGRHS